MAKRDRSIRLSEKHGVNPCIPRCFYCGEDKNQVVLMGRMKGDAEAPKSPVLDKEPCDKCKEYMQQGVMLLCVRDSDISWRTGHMCVVKDSAIPNMVSDPAQADDILKARSAFVPESAWKVMGLPMGDPA